MEVLRENLKKVEEIFVCWFMFFFIGYDIIIVYFILNVYLWNNC